MDDFLPNPPPPTPHQTRGHVPPGPIITTIGYYRTESVHAYGTVIAPKNWFLAMGAPIVPHPHPINNK